MVGERQLLYLTVLTFALHVDGTTSNKCQTYDADVLILGAGMSGVTAASILSADGIKKFLLFDAQDHIGGRMRNLQIDGVTVDIGAGWIQGVHSGDGTQTNPIMKLAQECGLRGNISDFESVAVYNETGADVTNSSDLRWDDYNNADTATETVSARLQDDDEIDISFRDALNISGWIPRSALDNIVEWDNFDFDYAYPPDEASLFYNIPDPSYRDWGDSDFQVTDQRGYRYLVDCIANKFLATNDNRLHLNSKVTKIHWSNECVCVEVQELQMSKTYCAQFAILTFGIGVLKSKQASSMFSPPLPTWKVDAIHQFRMVYYLNIFMKFNETFWNDEIEYFLYAHRKRGYWPNFQVVGPKNGKYLDPNANLLLATVTDVEALRISSQPTDVTKSEVTAVLRTIFGPHVPEPTKIFIPDYVNNPLFLGTWSDLPFGTNTTYSTEMLRQPVGRLHFSGEATNFYSATVPGAYLSGIDTAQTVIKQFPAKTNGCPVGRALGCPMYLVLFLVFTAAILNMFTV